MDARTIEPKSASGTVVRDIPTTGGSHHKDIFFTELWMPDCAVDGSHSWYSDGGPSSYNSPQLEEQIMNIPLDIGQFYMIMDTSENQPFGRTDGNLARSVDLNSTDVNALKLERALSMFGEMPLFSSSHRRVLVSRVQSGVTEIQSISISSDALLV